MIYFAYFHAVMEYGIVFWGDSVESKRIFQQHKRIIRIMSGSASRFVTSNLEIYKFNTSGHNINTRHKLKLHKPAMRLTMYQNSVYCNSINICNELPDDLAELVPNKKIFLQ
jgi:hypothetical protein